MISFFQYSAMDFFYCNLLVMSRPDDDWYLLQRCNCFKREQKIDKESNLNQNKVMASQTKGKTDIILVLVKIEFYLLFQFCISLLYNLG